MKRDEDNPSAPSPEVDPDAVIDQTRAAVGRLRAQFESSSWRDGGAAPPRAPLAPRAPAASSAPPASSTPPPSPSGESASPSQRPAAACDEAHDDDDTLTRLMNDLIALQKRIDRTGLFLRALDVAQRAGDEGESEPPAIAPRKPR